MVMTTGGAVGKTSLKALLTASAFLLSAAAHAAGLGKLTVLSNLGEPLRAEIDVVAVEKGELETLAAKLGTPDAYAQANLPYPSPSLGLKLTLEKRASGEPYISATTLTPVSEPFVDILVDLGWNGGRIQRAYTALLDPPSFAPEPQAPVAAAPTPSVRPAPSAAPEPPAVQTQLGSEVMPQSPPADTPPADDLIAPVPGAEAPAVAPVPGAEMPAVAEAPPPAEAGMPPAPRVVEEAPAASSYGPVNYGDTLSKIALQYKPENVSLEQMLVIMFRNNREAFSGNNMNRLRTGKVLQVPEPTELTVLDPKVARREVRLQTSDFKAYKQRLAELAGEAPAAADAMGQAAAGRVTGAPGEAAPPPAETPKEVLKLSKGEAPGAAGGDKASQDRIRSLEEEVAARDRTIREQNERVAKLERTVKDMQALVELKSKGMAELQKPAPAPEAPVAPAKPSAPEMAKAPEPAVPPAAVEPAAKPAETAPAPAARPKLKPKVVTPPPPPSFTQQLLSNPMYLAAAALVLLLVGGLAYMMMRRRRAEGMDETAAEKKTSDSRPAAEESSPSLAGAAAKASGADVAEEVDPLAEAEIYLAYGRDAQAEEILKEALVAHPRRAEIQVKLLDIYAKRKDVAAFDQVARDLQVATGGLGELWMQAARLGYQLSPDNPRYLAGKPSAEAAAAETAAAAASAAAAAKALDFQIDALEPSPEVGTLTDIDAGFGRRFATTTASTAGGDRLDLNIGDEGQEAAATKTDIDLGRLGGPVGAAVPSMDIDLDSLAAAGQGSTTDIDLTNLGAAAGGTSTDIDLSKIAEPDSVRAVDLELTAGADKRPGAGTIDFDFDLDAIAPAAGGQTVTRAMAQTVADVGEAGSANIEFDLSQISLEPSQPGKTEPRLNLGSAGRGGPELDLASINLDLGAKPATANAPAAAKDDRWYDVQTKFDLAKAYQEMGDKEGAREILREVISEGDAEQKAAAEKVLETLS
jgi:pilus assembly protein FimV